MQQLKTTVSYSCWSCIARPSTSPKNSLASKTPLATTATSRQCRSSAARTTKLAGSCPRPATCMPKLTYPAWSKRCTAGSTTSLLQKKAHERMPTHKRARVGARVSQPSCLHRRRPAEPPAIVPLVPELCRSNRSFGIVETSLPHGLRHGLESVGPPGLDSVDRICGRPADRCHHGVT